MSKKTLDTQDWSRIIKRQMIRKEHPATPSTSGEILFFYKKYFKKAIGRKRRAKVIVLGATPELRDIALEYGCEVVTVDLSLEQILKMTELMKHRNQPNEIIVRCNWLRLADILKNQNFDLIIGDGCFINLSLKGEEKLAKVCQSLLKKDGCFLIRETVIISKEKKPSSFYIEKYRQGRMKFPDLYINLALYATDIKIWNPKTRQFSYIIFSKTIKNLYRKGILNKKELKKLEKFVFPSAGYRFLFYRGEFEKLLKKYFKLLPVEQCKNLEFCQTFRFYLGRPKKSFKETR